MKQSELLRSDWTHLLEEREEMLIWWTQQYKAEAHSALWNEVSGRGIGQNLGSTCRI